jgi:phage shock protein C
MMAKKLYRSKKNRKIAGVCGGIAEYFDIDPIIIRLITLILVLSAGGGLIAYIIGWIIVPEESDNPYPVPVRNKKVLISKRGQRTSEKASF